MAGIINCGFTAINIALGVKWAALVCLAMVAVNIVTSWCKSDRTFP